MTNSPVRYQRNPDYIFRKIVDELVLVPVKANAADLDAIYTMNALGAFVWEHLGEATTQANLVAAITAEYEVAPDIAAADLDRFLAEMAAAGAVVQI